MLSPLIEQLINALRCLPGVGPKSAQRMAFNILERNRDNGLNLSKALTRAIDNVSNCQFCRTLSENALCTICSNPSRNSNQLCIVESPADVMAIEQTASYRGRYFVLMGHLSPIDGIGPEDIGLHLLMRLLDETQVDEIILATNPTVEGEATAHYIANLVKNRGIQCTRIAHGVPVGGELEYLDGNTLSKAFNARTILQD